MKTNEIPQANQLDNVHIISLLDRLEAAKKVLEKSEDIESTIEKLNNLEYFLRRFGTLKDLATHMLFIERKMYILKEYLTVTEAADYLNLSPSLVYRLTSKHELPIYKPNGSSEDINFWDQMEKPFLFVEMILTDGLLKPESCLMTRLKNMQPLTWRIYSKEISIIKTKRNDGHNNIRQSEN